MLWTLTIQLLNAEESLLGIHFQISQDPTYEVRTFNTTLGFIFGTIRLSIGFKKKEQ